MIHYPGEIEYKIKQGERFWNAVNITLKDGTVLDITLADLVEQGCKIRDRIDNMTSLIGNCHGNSCLILISNHSGNYTNYDFLRAEARIYVCTQSMGSTWNTLRGIFTITSSTINEDVITLEGVNNIIKTDILYVPTISFPNSANNLFQDVVTQCGLEGYEISEDIVIRAVPANCTCRNILIWLSQILRGNIGMNALYPNAVDTGGIIGFDSGESLHAYDLDLAHTTTKVTGVKIINSSGEVTLFGTEDYCINISNNPLIDGLENYVGEQLYLFYKDFEFIQFSGHFPPDPRFEIFDGITLIDKDGNEHFTLITNIEYDVSDKMLLECKLDTSAQNVAEYRSEELLTSEYNTDSKIEELSEEISNVNVDSVSKSQYDRIRFDGNNLIRNSNTYDFDDYYFTGTLMANENQLILSNQKTLDIKIGGY